MGRFKKEVTLFGREFKIQLFGISCKGYNPRSSSANTEVYRKLNQAKRKNRNSYNKAQSWARKNGYK